MGFFSDAMNPHKKHGYLTGDYEGDFWTALEMDYEEIRRKSDVSDLLDLGNLFALQTFLVPVCRYRILSAAVYTHFGGAKTLGERLERAIESAEESSHCRSYPYCESTEHSAAAELLQTAYKRAAQELRETYKNSLNRPLRATFLTTP